MSGGSLDYAYSKLDYAISEIAPRAKSPLHKAFLKHLILVKDALHDIEWVFSRDYSEDGADESIKKVLGTSTQNAQMEVIREELSNLIGQAQELMSGSKPECQHPAWEPFRFTSSDTMWSRCPTCGLVKAPENVIK